MSQALVLIDCQADFGAPDGAMAREGRDVTAAQAALAKAQALAQAARAVQVPVIFVRLLSDELCVEGTPGAAFVVVQPQAGDHVVTKFRFSAFTGTNLAEHLRGLGVDTIVLAGLTTECCVQASAWAAFEEGFAVQLAADACAAYEDDLHEGALQALALSGALVSDSANIADSWK